MEEIEVNTWEECQIEIDKLVQNRLKLREKDKPPSPGPGIDDLNAGAQEVLLVTGCQVELVVQGQSGN